MSFVYGFTQTMLCDFLTLGVFAIPISVLALIAWIIALCKGIRKTECTRAAVTYSFAIPLAFLVSFIFLKLVQAAPPPLIPGSDPRECLALQVLQVSPLAYCSGLAVVLTALGLYIWLANFVGQKAEQWLKVDASCERRKTDERERERKIWEEMLMRRRLRRGGD